MNLHAVINQKICPACGGTKFFHYAFDESYKGDLRGFEFDVCSDCGKMDVSIPAEEEER